MPRPITRLRDKAKRGDQGYPLGTLAFYGPDNKRATKAVLSIFLRDGGEPTLYRFFDEEKDIRFRNDVQEDILARIREHEVRSLVMKEEIFGCPHEEGIDYPLGEKCPRCSYWKDHDRFSDTA